jgi:hypothetical protein
MSQRPSSEKLVPLCDGVFNTVVALQCMVQCALKCAHRKHCTAYPGKNTKTSYFHQFELKIKYKVNIDSGLMGILEGLEAQHIRNSLKIFIALLLK